jgi:hypothetical protein
MPDNWRRPTRAQEEGPPRASSAAAAHHCAAAVPFSCSPGATASRAAASATDEPPISISCRHSTATSASRARSAREANRGESGGGRRWLTFHVSTTAATPAGAAAAGRADARAAAAGGSAVEGDAADQARRPPSAASE